MDKVKVSRWGDLIIGWEWICGYIWFLGWSDHLVVNEIVNLMTQTEALVGIMTMLLVKRIVFCEVMLRWKRVRKRTRF